MNLLSSLLLWFVWPGKKISHLLLFLMVCYGKLYLLISWQHPYGYNVLNYWHFTLHSHLYHRATYPAISEVVMASKFCQWNCSTLYWTVVHYWYHTQSATNGIIWVSSCLFTEKNNFYYLTMLHKVLPLLIIKISFYYILILEILACTETIQTPSTSWIKYLHVIFSKDLYQCLSL